MVIFYGKTVDFLNWNSYYNTILYLEDLIFNLYKLGLCSEKEYYRYKLTVNKHRIKFITRLYKLKILDYYFYRILRYSEGLNGNSLYTYKCYYKWINTFEIHPLSKSKIRIPKIILETECKMKFTEIEEENFLLSNKITRIDLAYLCDCITEENNRVLEIISSLNPNNSRDREKIQFLYGELAEILKKYEKI